MHGYSNLASSPPPMVVVTKGARARRSLELTNTKETNAWEGLAIGAVTLARTFSTGSQRLCRSGEKAKGLPGAMMRRACSMRRHPAAPGRGDGYYWRIHDMDGDSDHGNGDVDNAVAEQRDEEKVEKKKEAQRDEGEAKEEAKMRTPKKKRGNNVLRACKKLFRL